MSLWALLLSSSQLLLFYAAAFFEKRLLVQYLLVCLSPPVSTPFIYSHFSGSAEDPAPGTVYYAPHQFNHKGPLQIKKQTPVDVKAVFPDEKDTNPPNARFQFTEDQNEVYDIGSEVEKVID